MSRELAEAIALAQSETEIGGVGIGVPLLHDGVATATAHVLPLARGDLRTRLMPQATAAVFIAQAGTPLPADLGTIARVFGLTPAETKLLEQLVAGATLSDAAADLGIAPSTARTHRHRIFEKMGVARKSEMIDLVRRLVPPVRAG